MQYMLEGKPGQLVTIQVESRAFAPYLLILDDQGKKLAEQADQSQTSVSFNVPQTGTYGIVVTSVKPDGKGKFLVTVLDGQSVTQPSQISRQP